MPDLPSAGECLGSDAPYQRPIQPSSAKELPGQGAADHDALDLRGAFEDRVDLRVAVPLLHGEVPDVAVAAQDLDGLFSHPHGRLAGLELRHGTFGVLERAVARQPGGAVDWAGGPLARARSSLASSFSTPPTTSSSGIRQSSKRTSAVWDARMPSFFSFLPWRRPGVPGPTMNAACPGWPSSWSTVAT